MKKIMMILLTVIGLTTNVFGLDLNEGKDVQYIKSAQASTCELSGGTPIYVKDNAKSTKYTTVKAYSKCDYHKNTVETQSSKTTWDFIQGLGYIAGIIFVLMGLLGEKKKNLIIGIFIIMITSAKFTWLNAIINLFG